VNDPSHSPERRAHPRYTVDVAATVVVVNQGTAFSGRIFDLSLDGCGVHTDARQRLNSPVPVEIGFKINGIAFRLAGVMERADGQQVAGIRFSTMVPRRHDALVEVLAELDAESAAKAGEETASTPDCEGHIEKPRSEDPPAEVFQTKLPKAANLLAQAQPSSPADNHVPGRKVLQSATRAPSDANPMPPDPKGGVPGPPVEKCQSRGSDRRAQRRHSVDTRASILFIDVGARAEGRILDLSMSGCRIRTDERFPVGIYRRIETEFRLDGLPFRLGGVVQSLHDRHTVGIRFLDLSDRKRAQLCELVDEIGTFQQNRVPDSASATPEVAAQQPQSSGSS
jgi:hypothetical protein